jgi:hypothetical protein
VHALQKLHELVDQFWSEVAAAVPRIEELSEDEGFEVRASRHSNQQINQSIQPTNQPNTTNRRAS